jgi:hypothetical protein
MQSGKMVEHRHAFRTMIWIFLTESRKEGRDGEENRRGFSLLLGVSTVKSRLKY